MKWHKKGRIFKANGQCGWMNSHTQVPTPLVLNDRIRIFFATRPEDGMSRAAFMDVDRNDPQRILYLHDRPVLELGAEGMFDEHGTIPNYVFQHEGQLLLFYVGWSRQQSIPYSNWTGMAVSNNDGLTFEKCYPGPILDRTCNEVYSATGLICIEHEGRWLGWYATGTQWLRINDRFEHTYEIRSCESHDLIHWTRTNKPVFPNKLPNEANTRPTIVFRDGKWHMFFCYRGIQDFRDGADSYRIGYAWSKDLKGWVREDEKAGISASAEGWDSTMIAYPFVVPVENRVLMFYSGNGFGRDGFGYAELELNS
jgi:hypothetical protein